MLNLDDIIELRKIIKDKYNQTMLAQIITGGFLQLAKWWFLNKTTVNKEEMLKEVETLIKNNQFLK